MIELSRKLYCPSLSIAPTFTNFIIIFVLFSLILLDAFVNFKKINSKNTFYPLGDDIALKNINLLIINYSKFTYWLIEYVILRLFC